MRNPGQDDTTMRGTEIAPAPAAVEYALVAHPDTPAGAVAYVNVSLRQSEHGLDLAYVIGVPTERLVVPAATIAERTDGLWRTTCLELFVQTGALGYVEFNLSPSGAWAAYRFSDYRTGMTPLALDSTPRIMTSDEGDALILIARIADRLPGATMAGLSAVIEEVDGTKSFWALAHGDGPPDFHNSEGFIAPLSAPLAKV